MEEVRAASLFTGSPEDFPEIYHWLEQQFPENELHSAQHIMNMLQKKRYRLLLYRADGSDRLIGYALVFSSPDCSMLWLDYLAILPEYQGMGWGSAFFTALWKRFCGPYDGILFSVEHVCKSNPALAARQKARLEFYRTMGASRLHAGFLLPYAKGVLPMYLYCKPRAGLNRVSRISQIHTLMEMYDYCFFFMKERNQFLPRFKKTIQDEILSRGEFAAADAHNPLRLARDRIVVRD